ncbi:hypothetical protein HOY80DRAFT_1056768 [Tuber brumale]|nr:hypothetical protein HOY80DRAFT_1056768 [Tuber brumale]
MAVKPSLSSSEGSPSPSSASFRNHQSCQAIRRTVSRFYPRTTPSASSDAIGAIRTPLSTIASHGDSQTSPDVSPQFGVTTLSPTTSSPAITLAITSRSSSGPTATAATTPISPQPSFLHPPPEDVIRLLLSTTTYIYDSLAKLIDTNNTLRRSNSRIPRDQPICEADVRRSSTRSRTATAVGGSSTSCPNGMAHDALHIVDSHRAFAQAIKAEIAKLSAALAHFSPVSQYSRLRSLISSSLPTSIIGGGILGVKQMDKKHEYAGSEKVTIWSDVEKIISTYDWLWTYSYSASVKTWQEIIWACAIVTGVHGAGGLEAVNARMRDYGIAHAGVVDRFYAADRAVEREAEERRARAMRLGNQRNATVQLQHEAKKVVMIKRKMVKVDGKWAQQANPGVVIARDKGKVVNKLQEEEEVVVGCVERRWKVKLQVLGGVVAIGMKIKIPNMN